MVSIVLLGGCATTSPAQQEPPTPQAPTASAPQVVAQGTAVHRRVVEPQKLKLGNINASVIPLTLAGNALVPPNDPSVLGWWGTKAGAAKGVTLLVGHTVHTGGGALDDLETIPVGSDVEVSGVQYKVTSNDVISKTELARRAPHLFSQTGSHRLVVVTCEDYDPVTGHYRSNVVMVAK